MNDAGAQERKLVQQRRFDRQAAGIREATGPTGANFYPPAFRAPYLFLDEVLAARAKGTVVLDYGSGHGVHAILPARVGARVVQLDVSRRPLVAATSRFQANGLGGLGNPVQGDCEALPFPGDTFDIVLSAGALAYLDLSTAFAEITRVLKPHGQAIVVDTLGENPVLNTWRWLRWRRGQRTRREVDHIVRLADLQRIQTFFEHAEIRFFDLATVPCAIGGPRLFRALPAAMAIDRALLNRTPLRRLAFKFVGIFSVPRRRLGLGL